MECTVCCISAGLFAPAGEGVIQEGIGTLHGGLDADGKPADTRTVQQKEALWSLVEFLHFVFPDAKVYGHRDFANKACPCFDAKKEYANI